MRNLSLKKPSAHVSFLNVNKRKKKINVKTDKWMVFFGLETVTDMVVKNRILVGMVPRSPVQQVRMLPTEPLQIAYWRFLL